MTTYLNNPDAVRALVQPDRVHRDLYINQEIFQLEQTHSPTPGVMQGMKVKFPTPGTGSAMS